MHIYKLQYHVLDILPCPCTCTHMGHAHTILMCSGTSFTREHYLYDPRCCGNSKYATSAGHTAACAKARDVAKNLTALGGDCASLHGAPSLALAKVRKVSSKTLRISVIPGVFNPAVYIR